MHDQSQESGESRREFLKKAGAVAWVVPTMQIVNMASASAIQIDGSVVDTTKPPGSTTTTSTSSTTTTTTTTTTKPPCVNTTCRIKANYDGGWHWDTGQGANDCLTGGRWDDCDVKDIGASISGDDKQAKVTVGDNCKILFAKHKGGQICVDAVIDGNMATFTATDHGISHVEIVVECDCGDDA